jgi:hypothetical protein
MNSSFENNLAGSGPAESGVSGGDGGAVFVGSGGATVAADTFSANSAGDGGSAAVDAPNGALGGVGGSGGAIATLGSTTVLNDTITGNDAGSGGANSSPHTGSADDGVGGAVAVEGGSTSINYVTVASNQSGVAVTGGSATVTGTILSDNNTNCAGSITDLGYNLDNTDECNFVLASDLVDDSPALGALASNGGPTQTMLPSLSSPVIDAGATIANGCPTTDQRGDSRPDGGGTNPCDIGSVEQVVAP